MSRTPKVESLQLNMVFNIISQVITVLSPLVMTPKLARVFGADYLGVKGYTFSIVYYFAIFGVLGLDMYGQRKIAIEKDNLEQRSKTFWSIYLTRVFLVFVCTCLYVMYIMLFSSSIFERTVFICWLIYLVREMINPIWFLQGLEKYRLLSILGIISQLTYVFCTFVFVNEKKDLPLYIIFFTAIPLIISLCYFPTVFKNVVFVKIRIADMIQSVRGSFVYFVPTIATAIYSMVDKTMLGIFDVAKISTGLYEAAEKLVKVALAISTASFTIIRTRMSYLYGKKDRNLYNSNVRMFMSFSMMLCWPIMLGIMGITNDFVPVFFGQGFEEVIGLSYIFALVVPCLTISGLLQAVYIFPYGKQKSMDYYYIFIVSVNVIMNLVLISLFGTVGAIVATVFAEMLLAIILMVKANKDGIEVKYLVSSSLKYIVSAIVMFLSIKLVSYFVRTGAIYKVTLEFLIAVITYFVMCIVLRDSFVTGQIKKFFNKAFGKVRKNG